MRATFLILVGGLIGFYFNFGWACIGAAAGLFIDIMMDKLKAKAERDKRDLHDASRAKLLSGTPLTNPDKVDHGLNIYGIDIDDNFHSIQPTDYDEL